MQPSRSRPDARNDGPSADLTSPSSACAPPPLPGNRLSLCGICMQTCEDTIRRVGSTYSLRRGDFDDYMQEAWLAILTAVAEGRYDGDCGQLSSWLHIIARNRAVSFCRRRWRHRNSVVEASLDLFPSPLCEDPATTLERCCDIERVQEALRILERRTSPVGYAVFYLRQIRQRRVEEVAARLKLTAEQVRVYDHRARRKLTSILTCHGLM